VICVDPTYLDVPFRIDGRGRTEETDYADHVRDLIRQVLFTAPGERVNRPDFGCGISQLVFMPNSDALAAATQFLVQGALTRTLDHAIAVHSVDVASSDSTLTVTVVFSDRRSGELRESQFTSPWHP
jgi:phage baseplate assembly protein W